MRTLQAQTFSPLYAQLMDQIRSDIHRGLYAVGSRIPPEHELEINYGVSRVTVRRALQELTAEGLLERKQGKGTFVSMPRAEVRERRPQSFHDACRAEGRTPGCRVIRVLSRPADARDRAELLLFPTHSDDEFVFFGGLIPLYAAERGLRVQGVYMTSNYGSYSWHHRCHEKLDGLWHAGIRNYPVSNPVKDLPFKNRWIAAAYYGEDSFIQFQAEQIRQARVNATWNAQTNPQPTPAPAPSTV